MKGGLCLAESQRRPICVWHSSAFEGFVSFQTPSLEMGKRCRERNELQEKEKMTNDKLMEKKSNKKRKRKRGKGVVI